jgi:O-succinylbenzoate synthase
MPIYVWRYVLKSRTALNAISTRREFEGALVRIGDGFGCLHPWPELGDPTLGELLVELVEDRPASPLARQAVAMAALDESCRVIGKPVAYRLGLPVPPSHATLPGCETEAVEAAVGRGFTIVKVKGGRDYAELAGRLDEHARRWPELIWRIDFNEVLTMEETLRFVQCLTDHVWKRIDLLEDPCPYNPQAWEEIRRVTSLPLAMDRSAHANAPATDVLVVKPARDHHPDFHEGQQRLVVTSNMDHPLGQCFAAWVAARLAFLTERVDCCGLQTHDLFEPTAFSEELGPVGPHFQFPFGTGFGFDELLAKLPWKRLR